MHRITQSNTGVRTERIQEIHRTGTERQIDSFPLCEAAHI